MGVLVFTCEKKWEKVEKRIWKYFEVREGTCSEIPKPTPWFAGGRNESRDCQKTQGNKWKKWKYFVFCNISVIMCFGGKCIKSWVLLLKIHNFFFLCRDITLNSHEHRIYKGHAQGRLEHSPLLGPWGEMSGAALLTFMLWDAQLFSHLFLSSKKCDCVNNSFTSKTVTKYFLWPGFWPWTPIKYQWDPRTPLFHCYMTSLGIRLAHKQ